MSKFQTNFDTLTSHLHEIDKPYPDMACVCEQAKHDPGTETIARLAEALGVPELEVFRATR